MGVLAWLGIPAGATILAIIWVNWSARPRGPIETHQSLAQRERFKAACAKPLTSKSPEQRERRAS
jgi:hypothetical protein